MARSAALKPHKYFRIFRRSLDPARLREGEAILASLYERFPEAAHNEHLRKNILPVYALVCLREGVSPSPNAHR